MYTLLTHILYVFLYILNIKLYMIYFYIIYAIYIYINRSLKDLEY